VVGDSTLTFEELSTLLIQIEACLNSRPLCPISNDSTDLEILTPGQFLIGRALLTRPQPNLINEVIGPLQRWKLLEKLKQQFWNKWSTEYLSRLQQRPKWISQREDISVGELVLVKNDQLPPTKWPLGRILQTHPGPDGHMRVATVKCEDSTRDRQISKLCQLPKSEDQSSKHMRSRSVTHYLIFILTYLFFLGPSMIRANISRQRIDPAGGNGSCWQKLRQNQI
jgi:Family of unknown function (DUF5641)